MLYREVESKIKEHSASLEHIEQQKADSVYVNQKLSENNQQLNSKIGEVVSQVSSVDSRINSIIVTPAVGVSEQEIISARKGKDSLASKIDDIDSLIGYQNKGLFYHFYRFGNEYVDKTNGWLEGYKSAFTTGSVIKELDHINMTFTNTGGVADMSVVTDKAIDFTEINTLYIEWEQTINFAGARSQIVISRDKNSIRGNYNATVQVDGKFSKRLTAVDVSSLSGLYYVRVHSATNTATGQGNVKVYQIYTDLPIVNSKKLNDEKINIQSQMINLAYPIAPSSVDGYWTPEILEKQGGASVLSIYFRLRDPAHAIHVMPDKGKLSLYITWQEILAMSNLPKITIGNNDYINIPNNNALVVELTTGKFIVRNRINIDPNTDLILILNRYGVVSGGEALSWFVSPFKFTDDLLSDSVPINRKEDFNNLVFNSTKKANGINSLSFALITDTHGEKLAFPNMITYLNIIKKLEGYGKLDFICHCGDMLDGNLTNKNDSLKNINEATRVLNTKSPAFILNGNHDDNSYYKTANSTISDVITRQEWHNFALKHLEGEVTFDTLNPLGRYYYKDFTHQKIRVICLDSVDYPIVNNEDGTLKWSGYNGWGYLMRQINWFANEALVLKENDWQVIVFTHMGTNVEVVTEGSLIAYNSEHVEGILKAFKNGTAYNGTTVLKQEYNGTVSCDFTTQGARDVIGIFFGHSHRDQIVKPSNLGITLFNTTCGQASTNGAFDVITINREERKVYSTRFGNGVDREFSY